MKHFFLIGKKFFCSDKVDGRDKEEDDVYETIEFSDSSHIYTEPLRTENDYGALLKINAKTNETAATTISTTPPPGITKQTTSSRKSTSSHKVGIKKSIRVRNLHKFPAMQDVSKVVSSDSNDEVIEGEEKVELRAKPYRSSKRGSSKRMCALVSVGLHEN